MRHDKGLEVYILVSIVSSLSFGAMHFGYEPALLVQSVILPKLMALYIWFDTLQCILVYSTLGDANAPTCKLQFALYAVSNSRILGSALENLKDNSEQEGYIALYAVKSSRVKQPLSQLTYKF